MPSLRRPTEGFAARERSVRIRLVAVGGALVAVCGALVAI
jgi:hypothetical protein